ncbi:MAG TPA: hypothetical protein VFG69_04535 [Nannocystaceae bacterium]|nr:hypothetical protein [Nannocystaceae bacterium]
MTRYPLVLVLAAFAGCGGDKPPVDESIAKAMQMESKQQKIDEEAKERDRQERVAKAAEKKAADAQRDAELDALAVMPDTMPPDLAAACELVVNAYDGFMKRGRESDVNAWHNGRRRKLGERRQTCEAQGNLSVAACQSRALTGDPPSLAEVERTEAARLVMERCADKFAKSAG